LFKANTINQLFSITISFLRLILCLIFALPGNIMTLPLSTAIAFYAEQERIKALKNSVVKIKANDVVSSTKMFIYIVTYPVYVILFTFIFNRTLKAYNVDDNRNLLTFVFFLLYPIFSLISIRSHDGVRTHYTEFHGRLLSLCYSGQTELIQSTRKTLKKKVR
jgi:hypothetical protein